MKGCFRRQIVLQIEQVIERTSGYRLFQLFGDVMPETLFAVRSDSETYGMQRSVEPRTAAFLFAQRQRRDEPCGNGNDCRHASLLLGCHV